MSSYRTGILYMVENEMRFSYALSADASSENAYVTIHRSAVDGALTFLVRKHGKTVCAKVTAEQVRQMRLYDPHSHLGVAWRKVTYELIERARGMLDAHRQGKGENEKLLDLAIDAEIDVESPRPAQLPQTQRSSERDMYARVVSKLPPRWMSLRAKARGGSSRSDEIAIELWDLAHRVARPPVPPSCDAFYG